MTDFYFNAEEAALIQTMGKSQITSRKEMINGLIHALGNMDLDIQDVARRTIRKISALTDDDFVTYMQKEG